MINLHLLPKDLILLIANCLSSLDFFRFWITNKRIYKILQIKEEEIRKRLVFEFPKKAAKYIVTDNKLELFIQSKIKSEVLLDNIYFYSISYSKLDILKYLVYNRYPAPDDLLYTSLCKQEYEIADYLYFRDAKITTAEIVWLLRSNPETKSWLLQRNIIHE